MRIIRGLKWARELPTRPPFIPKGQPRGAKLVGIQYEDKLAKAFPELQHGVWFEFEDKNGHGCCSPDFILEGRAIIEAKNTFTPEGFVQLEKLYMPVLEATYGKVLDTILVCKVLTSEAKGVRICRSLEEALSLNGIVRRAWHWIGPMDVRPRIRPLRARALISDWM